MTAKTFFQKLKGFVKRNLPAMAVAFCMIFALSLVTAVAVTRVRDTEVSTVLETNTVPTPDPEIPVNASEPIVFAMPVEGATEGLPFAQDYLVKYESLEKWQTHEAVDFVAIAGTKVVCAYDGKVESIETDSREGTVVLVDHGNGLKTVYKSISSDVVVEVGDEVKKGEQIGVVATNAVEASQGAHLHFEVLLNGSYVDPFDYLPSGNK